MSRCLLIAALLCVSALAYAADPPSDYELQAEQQMLQSLNAERVKQGLPALEVDPRLVTLARQHSRLMAERKELSHQFEGEPDLKHRYATTDLRWNFIGENVAEADSAAEAHQGLMMSPPHRENILNKRYNTIGIGVVLRGPVIYVTEDFAQRLDELSSSDAERALASQFITERKKHSANAVEQKDGSALRTQACGMAQRDSLDLAKIALPPNSRYVVAFTTTKLEVLPANVEHLVTEPGFSQFEVGVCFARSATYPSGTYWAIMAFQ